MKKATEATQRENAGPITFGKVSKLIEIAGYAVSPMSLNTQILLEEIGHPIVSAESPIPLSGCDTQHLIFIFLHPEEAWRTLNFSKPNFCAAARQFAFSIAPEAVALLAEGIEAMIFATRPADPSVALSPAASGASF